MYMKNQGPRKRELLPHGQIPHYAAFSSRLLKSSLLDDFMATARWWIMDTS
jgi:hypothetical protein